MERKFGVKLYDSDLCNGENLDLMQSLGFNTIFLGRDALSLSFTQEITKRRMFWNIVEPIFLLDTEDTSNSAILADGKPAQDDWVNFACPTDKKHLEDVKKQIINDIAIYNPPGLSLDFLRFFQFWEMTDPNIDHNSLPQTCFCDRCKEQQKGFKSIGEWRMNLVSDTARMFVKTIRDAGSKAEIGIHYVPWTQDMFGGAIKDVIGQDITVLSKIGDYITPMIYHHMMHMKPSYVGEFLSDIYSHGCERVLPSIQVKQAYREDELPAKEFRKALEQAVQQPSEGVVMYKWEDLVTDQKRMEIVKQVLGEID